VSLQAVSVGLAPVGTSNWQLPAKSPAERWKIPAAIRRLWRRIAAGIFQMVITYRW